MFRPEADKSEPEKIDPIAAFQEMGDKIAPDNLTLEALEKAEIRKAVIRIARDELDTFFWFNGRPRSDDLEPHFKYLAEKALAQPDRLSWTLSPSDRNGSVDPKKAVVVQLVRKGLTNPQAHTIEEFFSF